MPSVAINEINIGSSRRALKDQKVADLMESIRANGLLNPITIDQEFNLIAGLHRLTACKLLGYQQVECKIITCTSPSSARLAEIDENLIRSELDTLERSELWLERDKILEQLGIRAQPGDNQHKGGGEMISPPVKTTLELAKQAGYTKRTFQQGKQIAKSIVPEVKEAIKGTPIAKSTTALLKVARAGTKERKQAEQAEQAAREAKARQKQKEIKRQAKLAADARNRQRELQLIALYSTAAEREAKLAVKRTRPAAQQTVTGKLAPSTNLSRIQVGDEWMLDRHLVCCADTSSKEFMNHLPSNAALAIATPSSTWNHDYLIDEARVVAVLRSEGHIYHFSSRNRMPFRYELMLGDFYLAVFSHQVITKPEQPVEIEGVEGIVAYLVSLYTNPYNFVIAPFLGHGEVLVTCEKMGRVCFAGEENPDLIHQAINRWQQWTGKQAEKVVLD